jgi:membrane protease YdiL (CAAX protease family)
VLVAGVLRAGIPALAARGIEPLAGWLLLSPPLVFLPLLAAAWCLLRAEAPRPPWRERLRLGRPTRRDWLWGSGGLAALAIGSGLAFQLCLAAGLEPLPPFARQVAPLGRERLWLLGLWLVNWPLNILGEELVWRGVVLPRMEAQLGAWAWLWNGLLWGLFHLSFGPGNLIVLLPTLLLVPFVAQRRRNTWLAVLMHAGLSAPGFAGLALGLA